MFNAENVHVKIIKIHLPIPKTQNICLEYFFGLFLLLNSVTVIVLGLPLRNTL